MKKIIIHVCFCALFAFSCSKPQRMLQVEDMQNVQLESKAFKSIPLDSTKILYVTGIYAFQDYIILMEPQNNPTLSFWSRDT